MMARLLVKCMFERATVTAMDHDASIAGGWRGGVLPESPPVRSKTVAATEREVAELHNDSNPAVNSTMNHNNNSEDAIDTKEPPFQ